MTITSLETENFQKHKKKKLVFDARVTTIGGRTGAGKSCLVRALAFGLINRGGSVGRRAGAARPGRKNRGEKVARVTIRIDRNQRIVRRKGPGVNSYSLDGKKYKAFGLGKVPPEVHSVTRCAEINFQGQHDQAYWFHLSAGQVSKELNRIVNLAAIDRALDRAAQTTRKTTAEVVLSKERLAEARQEAGKLAWVEAMRGDLADLRARFDNTGAIAIKRSVLSDLVSAATRAAQRADLASKAILCVKRAADTGRQWAATRAKREELAALVKEFQKHIKVSRAAVPEIETLRNVRAVADKAAEDRRALEELVVELKERTGESCRLGTKLTKLQRRLKKFPRCPACKRPM